MDGRTGANRRQLIAALAALGLAATHPGEAPRDALARQSTPEATTNRIGPPQWFLSLISLQDPYPGLIQAPAEPPAKTRYIAAELQIDNDSDQPLNFTPTDIRLRDEAGFEYRGGTAIGQEPMLNARNLNAGERSRGWVWFTVAADAHLVEMIYVAPAPVYRATLSG
jgi:hypothetical protein